MANLLRILLANLAPVHINLTVTLGNTPDDDEPFDNYTLGFAHTQIQEDQTT